MENLKKKPAKGILKSSSSFEQPDPIPAAKSAADIKWDEMNILQTLHPADKDYGHMKIEEPKTPYSYQSGSGDEGEACGSDGVPTPVEHKLDPENLLQKIASRSERRLSIEDGLSGGDDDEADDESLTEEERKKKREFEMKRKSHYNEFQAVKLARQLLEEEDEDDDGTRGDENELCASDDVPEEAKTGEEGETENGLLDSNLADETSESAVRTTESDSHTSCGE